MNSKEVVEFLTILKELNLTTDLEKQKPSRAVNSTRAKSN